MTSAFEVAIIGAGPAGLAAAANAARHGIAHVLFEKAQLANTIYEYQLRKHVMAEPTRLPLRSELKFQAGKREEILAEWQTAVKDKRINTFQAEVLSFKKDGTEFEIIHQKGSCRARNVILAIGVQGSPRRLEVPGDDQPHVRYSLNDPAALNDLDILVIGAGDAAIENALALAESNRVSILNRGSDFARAKDANANAVQAQIDSGRIRCFYNSKLIKIDQDKSWLETPDGQIEVRTEHIIARLGCILPRKFLDSCGISFPNSDPTTPPVVSSRYESNVKGLYLVGAIIGYPLIKQAMNQGHEVIEHILGHQIEPADQPLLEEKLKELPGKVIESLDMLRRSLPLFHELSDPQFRELIIESNIQIKKVGEIVFFKNDYSDSFYNVVAGAVSIERPDKTMVRIGQGDFFGEMGLLSGRRRSATVIVTEPAIILETPRKQMLKLISSVSSIKRYLDELFMLRALQTTIFPDIEAAFLDNLIKKAQIKNFKKGEYLFKEGDIADLLYVIRKGSVKIVRKAKNNKEIVQSYLSAGNYVGEMGLISTEPTKRSASVIAAVGLETITITKQDFLALLEHNPAVKLKVLEQVASRKIENAVEERTEGQSAMLDFMMREGASDAENLIIIDSDKCIGCDNCESACAATHSGYSRLNRKGGKSLAAIQMPISCRHCENPLCMLDCPPDALVRNPNGEIIIRDTCIGCGNCQRNCPYGVIQMVYDKEESGFSLLSILGLKKSKSKQTTAKAGKCDLCVELPGGPACVRSCPTGAAIRINPAYLLELVASKDRAEDHT